MKKANRRQELSWRNVVAGAAIGTAILFILFFAWLRLYVGLPLSAI